MSEASAYVDAVARKSGSNFYLSFFSLPREKRDALTAVYAFCREVDDVVDVPRGQDPRLEIAAWRDEIARTYEGRPSRPLTQSLAGAIQRFDLTRAYFEGILAGVEMDLNTTGYPTFEALSRYCYHVAGEVGLLCMEIFGFRSDRLKDYAVKTGLALQLTNILRDVGADAAQGRIYLPQEELLRFGVTEEDLKKKRRTAQFSRLMQFEVERARRIYVESETLPKAEEKPALVAAEIMRAVYRELLERIERRKYDVFSARVRVPGWRKIWLATRAWWACR